MKKYVIGILSVVALLVAIGLIWFAIQGPSQNTDTDNSQNTAPESTTVEPGTEEDSTHQEVFIESFAFSPAKLTIKKGTQVTWVNNDDVQHNVVADDETNGGGLPGQAPLLSRGEAFTHTFDTVGTFNYHCMPHPNMKGTIEVVD